VVVVNDADGNAYNHSVKYKVGTTETTTNGTVEATVAGGAIDVTNTYEKAKLEITKTVSVNAGTPANMTITFVVTGPSSFRKTVTMAYPTDFAEGPKTVTLTQVDGILPNTEYTVTETASTVNQVAYTRETTVGSEKFTDESVDPNGKAKVSAAGSGSISFGNVYTQKTKEVTVNKVWSFAAANSAVAEADRVALEGGAKWPKDTTVKVKLQKKVGTSGTVTDVEGTDATAILSSEKPSHTFSGLVAYEGTNEITYSVKEVEISGTYANNFTQGAAEKQEDGSYKITNNEKVAGLTITKSFGDSDLTDAQKAGITFKVTGTGLKKDGAAAPSDSGSSDSACALVSTRPNS